MIYEHNPFNPMTLHAVNTCPFDENAVLLKRSQVRNVLREVGMVVVIEKYHVYISAFFKVTPRIRKISDMDSTRDTKLCCR
jgi:hypothetical protein